MGSGDQGNNETNANVYTGRFIVNGHSHAISVPRILREKMQIRKGDWFHLFDMGNFLVMVKVSPRAALQGLSIDVDRLRAVLKPAK
jgi:hypothetical protein